MAEAVVAADSVRIVSGSCTVFTSPEPPLDCNAHHSPGDARAFARNKQMVRLLGNVFFVKLLRPGDERSAERELRAYMSMKDIPIGPEERFLQLHGLVTDGLVTDDGGLILGLLLSYIDCEAKTLACAVRSGPSGDLRRKWGDQLSLALRLLNASYIFWGDVKPENVLIDGRDDAWIVDFGGGYTEGWVDENQAGTAAGDAQGLANLLKFIPQ